MSSDNNGEPEIRGADTFGLAGTSRDKTRKLHSREYIDTLNQRMGNTYANIPNIISSVNDDESKNKVVKVTREGNTYFGWNKDNKLVEEYDENGISRKDRSNYLPFLDSDSGEIPKSSIQTTKAPAWALTLVVMLGILLFGFSAYSYMSSLNNVSAQSAPMPEEEDLFDYNSSVTYTGPQSHQIDWDEEFSKVERTVHGNLGSIVIPSVDIYSEMIATGEQEGKMVLPESPLSSWYENSAPIGGKEGNSIVASHVNHRDGQSLAPFSRLNNSERGTLVGVEDHEGNRYIYEVTDMSLYERIAIPKEYFRTDGDHRLHLVTCSGDVIEDNVAGDRVFEHNLIVTAELLEEIPAS